MVWLVRKLTRAKWEATDGIEQQEIPADAVTSDLRTTGNKLSFWKCENITNTDLCDVVLAMAAAAERIDRMDLVWIERTALGGIVFEDSPGRTPIADMVGRHTDAVSLDLDRLGKVARQIAEALRQNRFRRWTRGEVDRILRDALTAGRVRTEQLPEEVRKELERKPNR